MHRFFSFAPLAFLVACSGTSFTPPPGDNDGGDASAPNTDVATELQSKGFTLKSGSFSILDLSTCCQTTCSGNNPTSPYGAVYLPDANGTSSNTWRLRSDEAVLVVGTTPPEAAYYGFTPYLMDRADAQGNRKPIFASLSETLNNAVIATAGPNAFESKTAIIASGDQTTTNAVKDALVRSGHPSSAINVMTFDPVIARFGLEANADTFGVLFRYALPKDAAKKDAYLQAPGASVWRVTPSSSSMSSSAPLPSPMARNKSPESSELALKPAVQRLAAAIVTANPNFNVQPLLVDDGVGDPNKCIGQLTFCAGDNRDTTYPSMIPRVLFASDDDFYVVYGVDHVVSGKTTYSNASVYAAEKLVGLKSVASNQYPGSAQQYLPNDIDAPKLYAWKIARSCNNGEPHCLEVPKGACPTGIENGALGWISFRTYLEPTTKTAPDPATIVRDGILRFTKK